MEQILDISPPSAPRGQNHNPPRIDIAPHSTKNVCSLPDRYLADIYLFIFRFSSHSSTFFPASGQAVVTGVVPSAPRFLLSFFFAHRVQQSHCSSIFRRVLLTHALGFSASQFMRKEKVPTILHAYALGGIRTHETELYQARG